MRAPFLLSPTAIIKRQSRGKRKEETGKVLAQSFPVPFLFSPPATYKYLIAGGNREKNEQEMNRESSKEGDSRSPFFGLTISFLSFYFFLAEPRIRSTYIFVRGSVRKKRKKKRTGTDNESAFRMLRAWQSCKKKELILLSYFLFLVQAQSRDCHVVVTEGQAWPRNRNKKETGHAQTHSRSERCAHEFVGGGQ